jgi:CheY-like chemotaxis protein
MKYCSIIIVDDDPDNRELIQSALGDINIINEQICFENGVEAFEYLNTTSEKPLLILSDIDMPLLNGFELKQKIDSNEKLRQQKIPFIFLSTTDDINEAFRAYELMIQGHFRKPTNYEDLKILLKVVVNSWVNCQPTY